MAKALIPDAIRRAESDALFALWKERSPKLSQGSFGKRFGVGSQGMVWQYLHNHRALNLEAAAGFARGLAVPMERCSPRLAAAAKIAHRATAGPNQSGVEPHYAQEDWSHTQALSQGEAPARAHSVSYIQPTIELPICLWESIVVLPPEAPFRLQVLDDAMRLEDPPSMRQGDWAFFRPSEHAQPGQVVLVADKRHNLYIRKFQQRTPDHWLAVPRHPGYEALDSVRDGLRIIAVQFGGTWE